MHLSDTYQVIGFFASQEAHVNTCYKHFYYFVTEFDMLSQKELEPLKELTAKICRDSYDPSLEPLFPGPSGAMANPRYS